MRMIVIGASGLIGGKLYDIAKADGKKVIGTCNNNEKAGLLRFDMLNDRITSAVKDLGGDDVVYLLSAYSNPSWIFDNLKTARKLNVDATRTVIDDALNAGARLIFMSSVEVFNGRSGNYNEASAPDPLNEYGKMKYEIEEYLAKKNGKSCVVRTGWNVGWTLENRCVVKLTYETLLKPGARMASDNIFSIIDVNDTAAGLLRLSGHPEITKCHLASEPPVVRTELADAIIRLSRRGKKMGYVPVNFSEIEYSEPRARLNHLDNSLSKSKLGMKYAPSDDVIRRKIEFLDREA